MPSRLFFESSFPDVMGSNVDPNQMHKVIWRAFPGCTGVAPFLFRRVEPPTGLPKIVVRSTVRPQWGDSGVLVREVNLTLEPGMFLTVDVVLNTVVRNHRSDHVGYCEYPIREQNRMVKFLVDKATQAGLDILSVGGDDDLPDDAEEPLALDVRGMPWHQIQPTHGSGFLLRTKQCLFLAEVRDADAALNAYEKGLGRKKRYGCGMPFYLPPNVQF